MDNEQRETNPNLRSFGMTNDQWIDYVRGLKRANAGKPHIQQYQDIGRQVEENHERNIKRAADES